MHDQTSTVVDYEGAAEIFRDALTQYGIDVDAGAAGADVDGNRDRIGDEGTSVQLLT